MPENRSFLSRFEGRIQKITQAGVLSQLGLGPSHSLPRLTSLSSVVQMVPHSIKTYERESSSASISQKTSQTIKTFKSDSVGGGAIIRNEPIKLRKITKSRLEKENTPFLKLENISKLQDSSARMKSVKSYTLTNEDDENEKLPPFRLQTLSQNYNDCITPLRRYPGNKLSLHL